MNSLLGRVLPSPIKAKLKQSGWGKRAEAVTLAKHSKRLDLCAAQVAHMFHLSGSPLLQDTVCLEIGAGWVLSHALVFHLLGARRVIAADIAPLAAPPALKEAIRTSVLSLVRDILSPFCPHNEIRARLDRLLAIDRFSWATLKELGIEYRAPLDLSRERLNVSIDFIYSNSVLEYVPDDRIPPLLANIAHDLKPGGTMIHSIHLEDLADYLHRPFDFYRAGYQGELNRVRSSRWRQYFDQVPDLDSRLIFQWRRCDKELPVAIDPSLYHEGEDDLRISHIGVMAAKKQLQAPGEQVGALFSSPRTKSASSQTARDAVASSVRLGRLEGVAGQGSRS